MAQSFEEKGVKVVVSVWPTVENKSHNYEPMKEKGYFVSCPQANDLCHEGNMYLYDATNPEARQFVWQQVTIVARKHQIKSIQLYDLIR